MLAVFIAALLATPTSDTHTIDSTSLEEVREFRVALPQSYADSTVGYPVLYVLDGRYNLDLTTDVLGHLSPWATVPEMIVVAVHNTSRELDMTPAELRLPSLDGETGRADRFLDFFEDELIPFVDEHYRTRPLRILVGHSHGGLFTSYALTDRPDLFAWHLALDAPVHHENGWMMERLTEAVAKDPGLAKRYVSVQQAYRWPEQKWAAFAAAASPRFLVARIDDLDETHESLGFLGTAHGLKRLFGDYAEARDLAVNQDTLTGHFATLTEAYGYEVDIPLRLRLEMAQDLTTRSRGTEARSVLLAAQRDYGDSSTIWRLMGDAERVIANGEDGTTVVDELTSLPPEKVEAASAYLGIWEGTSFHEGGVPVHMIVTLEADGDIVSATTSQKPPFGGDYGDPEPLAFLRVVADGALLEWGELNRRGPGIGVYRMALGADDVLEGTIELRGIPDGLLPDDFEMPVIHVNLKRRARGAAGTRTGSRTDPVTGR